VTIVEGELERLLAALESDDAAKTSPSWDLDDVSSATVTECASDWATVDVAMAIDPEPREVAATPSESGDDATAPLFAEHQLDTPAQATPETLLVTGSTTFDPEVLTHEATQPAARDDVTAELEAELARFESPDLNLAPVATEAVVPPAVHPPTGPPSGEDATLASKRGSANRRKAPVSKKRSRKKSAGFEAPVAPFAPPPPLLHVQPVTVAAASPAIPVESCVAAITSVADTAETPSIAEHPAVADRPPLAHEPWRIQAPIQGLQAKVPLAAPSRPTADLPSDPWNVETEASKVAQVLPFAPRAVERAPNPPPAPVDLQPPSHRHGDVASVATESSRVETALRSIGEWQASAGESREAEPLPAPSTRRGWRINWKRTAAASLAVMLLEGVAFATAYWFVKPAGVGKLLVQTSQSGIEVLIDGRKSGVTPLTVELKPGRYTLEMRGYGATKVIPVEISPGVQTTQSVRWPRGPRLGKLSVKTTPTGARILVDGTYRGVSPLTLDDVAVGQHLVVAESPSGVVKNQARVEENEIAEVDIGIFSGWLTVFAPVEVRVFEAGKLLGTSLDGKLLVSAGSHQLELVNKRLGYREIRTVEIEPGKDTTLSVQAPNGSIIIEAPDGTEVILDGQSAGMMPIEKVSAPIGTREIVLKHPALGQRRVTVTVGMDAPARVSLLAPQ
jgi:hypothetical protein